MHVARAAQRLGGPYHRVAQVTFLDDGGIEMDTNTVERVIWPIAHTRKNALFAGSDGGARHWAIAMRLIQTAKLNGVEPIGNPRFFTNTGPHSLAAVAQAAGCEPPSRHAMLTGLAGLENADPQHVSFLGSKRLVSLLDQTRAGVVLVRTEMASRVPEGSMALIVDDPFVAWARIAALFLRGAGGCNWRAPDGGNRGRRCRRCKCADRSTCGDRLPRGDRCSLSRWARVL